MAVQCKCYDDGHVLGKRDIDSFLAESQRGNDRGPVFVHRWIVSTCRWGRNAQEAIESLQPGVSHIDFRAYLDRPILEEDAARPVRPLLPRQAEALDDVVFGLGNHDRGRLVMACGTGRTFTSLRTAERIVADRGPDPLCRPHHRPAVADLPRVAAPHHTAPRLARRLLQPVG